jgi:hypothetical protein
MAIVSSIYVVSHTADVVRRNRCAIAMRCFRTEPYRSCAATGAIDTAVQRINAGAA